MKPAEFRALRNRLGWSQNNIADDFGTNQDSVSKFERGMYQRPRWPVSKAAEAMMAEAERRGLAA